LHAINALSEWFARSWASISATIATARAQVQQAGGGGGNDDTALESQSNVLDIVLQLLNILATKDFLLDDDDDVPVTAAAEQALIVHVVSISLSD
jgi:hypothetical protein